MILYRYLTREIIYCTLAITVCLFLLFFGHRFSQYLEEASTGNISVRAIGELLLYRIPDHLIFILPISYFISIFVAYGRLYADNEMVVIFASGVSRYKVFIGTLISAFVVAIVVGILSMIVTPIALNKLSDVKAEERNRHVLEFIQPKTIGYINNNQSIAYFIENYDLENNEANNINLLEPEIVDGKLNSINITSAQSAREEVNSAGDKYLVLENAKTYKGMPGRLDFKVSTFKEGGILLAGSDGNYKRIKIEQFSFFELLRIDSKEAAIEIQWRVSFPIMVLVLTTVAVSLGHTSPRKGRYYKIIPACLICLIYFTFLIMSKQRLQEDKLSLSLGLWWVHSTFLIFGMILFWVKRKDAQ